MFESQALQPQHKAVCISEINQSKPSLQNIEKSVQSSKLYHTSGSEVRYTSSKLTPTSEPNFHSV